MSANVSSVAVVQGAASPVIQQLLREFVSRQPPSVRIVGLIENGGGVMGFDEAACAVTILEKSA